MSTKYVIVKYAADTAWEWHHKGDPKEGALLEDSCHSTYTGKKEGILPEYLSRVPADIDCWRLNAVNPSGWYAVCVVKEEPKPLDLDTYVIVEITPEDAYIEALELYPKRNALLKSSCHNTYQGKAKGILPEYSSKEKAILDRKILSDSYPLGEYRVRRVRQEVAPITNPEVCCGEYSTCSKPCTPRGIEIGRKEAAYKGPSKFAPEEIARGNVGIRWVTPDEVCGRPTEHDVREYLHEAGQLGLCSCPECAFFYRSSKRLEGQNYAKVLHALEMNRVFVVDEKAHITKEVTPKIILEAIEILKQLSKTEV